MLALSDAMNHHIHAETTSLCTCWLIIRHDKTKLGFTNHNCTLMFDGITFEPASGVTGSALQQTADMAVDNSMIDGALTSDMICAHEIELGHFDGATIEIWRVNWKNTDERVLQKCGILGEVTMAGHGYQAEIRGLSHVLDQTLGRVYQTNCDARLGDEFCTVNLQSDALQGVGSLVVQMDSNRLRVTGIAHYQDQWFQHGVMQFKTGAAAGTSRHIKEFFSQDDTSLITIWQPLNVPLSPGDQLIVRAGCDKRFTTCRSKFDNGLNFRGFPHIPGNDVVTAYPAQGEKHDGGRRQ